MIEHCVSMQRVVLDIPMERTGTSTGARIPGFHVGMIGLQEPRRFPHGAIPPGA